LKRRNLAAALALIVLAAAGVWLYRNSHLPTLRREFIPWMERLGRWRDGVEAVQRA
jgi:hypothetical protein